MVTGIACLHYFYMRGVWVETDKVLPFSIMWINGTTANHRVLLDSRSYCRCTYSTILATIVASVVMLVGGYLGEVGTLTPMVGFVIGMLG